MEFISLVIPSTLCKYSTMRRKSFQRFNISLFKGTDVYRWLHEVQLAFFLYLCRQHQGAESRAGVRALMRLWTVASLAYIPF